MDGKAEPYGEGPEEAEAAVGLGVAAGVRNGLREESLLVIVLIVERYGSQP